MNTCPRPMGLSDDQQEVPWVKVAVYAFPGVSLFHLSVPQLVFDEVTRQEAAHWQVVLVGDRAGSVMTAEGHLLGGVLGPKALEGVDVVVVPSWFEDGRTAQPSLLSRLRRAHGRGAQVVGLCLGAFVLAQAGLLSGRRAVTHWQAVALLARQHPDIEVESSVLYIDHGDVMTSAGTASGIDACLHLVRSHLGAQVANDVARALVVAPHRDGGQAQFISRPVAQRSAQDPVAVAQQWAMAHLDALLTVEALAAAAHMSRRTFVRAFQRSTGTTPASWVRTRRLDEARRLLEVTDLPLDRIAALTGFGSAVTLRQNFGAAYNATPSQYRRRFDARPSRTAPTVTFNS